MLRAMEVPQVPKFLAKFLSLILQIQFPYCTVTMPVHLYSYVQVCSVHSFLVNSYYIQLYLHKFLKPVLPTTSTK